MSDAAQSDSGQSETMQATMAQPPEPLFQARIAIYPRSVKGRYRNLKYGILALAYGIYFLLPWLRWARTTGSDQAVLFDLTTRKFYLFNLVVYPQDIFWLAGILVIAAMLLFFVTGLAGRVFCGYFCFQTLWTDAFMLIEHLVQGQRNKRLRLAKQAWGAEKVAKIGLTHVLWLLLGLLTGLSFTLYWDNAPTLTVQFFTGTAPFAAYATALFIMVTTYVMAGMAREQVCTYMCPYARFQSTMFDKDTLIVAYDAARGEGMQGRHKPTVALKTHAQRQSQGYGDCIDCGYCVQVCPTGIDIRNGLQIECITCALCIDACNTIMDSIGYPRGLIRYSSERSQETGKTQWLKAKTIGYALVLAVTTGLLISSIMDRSTVEMTVRQIRSPLSVTLSNGEIQNRYEIKVSNKTEYPMHYELDIHGLKMAKLDMGNFARFELQPESSAHFIALIRQYPKYANRMKQAFYFVAKPISGKQTEQIRFKSMFYVPDVQLRGADK